MAIKRHVQHIRSSVADSIPTTEQLGYGEIAVNYSADKERLFIKNANNEIVPFYSGKVIEENERVTAAALSDLDGRINGIDDSINDIDGRINDLEENSVNTENMENITYSELASMAENGKLVPGKHYRITDYVTTTAKSSTSSAGHQFDLIVVAISETKISENAYADIHENDQYFKDCALHAWSLKYCLKNDETRFSWADDNGKGVIYYMKDEWGNECPYDFKNILFPRKIFEGKYDPTNGTDEMLYTFTWITPEYTIEDASITCQDGQKSIVSHSGVYGNIIGGYFNEEIIQDLNDIVFIETYHPGEQFFGTYYNKFGSSCYHNTFGNYIRNNVFGDNFYGNVCGNDVRDNDFGHFCIENKLGDKIWFNHFGNYFRSNNFGNAILSNVFNPDVSSCILANGLSSCNFGSDVRNITANASLSCVSIDNGNCYITLVSSGQTDTDSIQNVEIANGVNLSDSTTVTITHDPSNNSVKTTYQPQGSIIVNL